MNQDVNSRADGDRRRLVDTAAAWPDDVDVSVGRTAPDGRGTCTVLRDLRRWFAGVAADGTSADGLPTLPVAVVRTPEHHRTNHPA